MRFLMLAALGLSASAWADPFADPKVLDADGFRDFYAQVAPAVFVSGQPSEAGLARAKAAGVRTIVNLRTDAEMNDRGVVPYDEAAAAAALGLDYVRIPLGGPDTPYTPAAVAAFADALEAAEGGVLLHCTVAWRASHMWAAYLVANQGFTIADALAVGQKLNLGGYPFADLLGRRVSLEPRDE